MKKYIRFTAACLSILLGAVLMVLYIAKVVPTGWEDSRFLSAIVAVWAYGGLFIAPTFILIGVTDLVENLGNRRIMRRIRRAFCER